MEEQVHWKSLCLLLGSAGPQTGKSSGRYNRPILCIHSSVYHISQSLNLGVITKDRSKANWSGQESVTAAGGSKAAKAMVR